MVGVFTQHGTSRFDRKYHFELPDTSVRFAYIAMWNNQLKSEMRLSTEAINQIAAHTDDFSLLDNAMII